MKLQSKIKQGIKIAIHEIVLSVFFVRKRRIKAISSNPNPVICCFCLQLHDHFINIILSLMEV